MMSLKASFVIFLFALATSISCNAIESPAELYWKSKLGNMTIPKVLKASLLLGSDAGIVKLNSKVHLNQPLKYEPYYHLNYRAENHVPEDGRVEFFTNEKLTIGTKIKLHFNRVNDGSKFLPLHITKSMTFVPQKLHEILNVLSINPKSIEAEHIVRVLLECGEKGVQDEVRYCPPSLEAMVDVVTSSSNSSKTKLMVASTQEENDSLKDYTIQKVQKLGDDDQHNLICHKLKSPFVLFMCQNLKSSDTYGVSLVDTNRKQINAVAVCHKDTSNWYPGHASFKILNLKPGGEPICHFLSGDAMIWIRTIKQ